jgi:hypothetical protein
MTTSVRDFKTEYRLDHELGSVAMQKKSSKDDSGKKYVMVDIIPITYGKNKTKIQVISSDGKKWIDCNQWSFRLVEEEK